VSGLEFIDWWVTARCTALCHTPPSRSSKDKLVVGETSPLHSLTAQLASLVQTKINREGVKVVGGLILLILALVLDILLYRYGHQLRHWLGGL
jgi:hypothetical protein